MATADSTAKRFTLVRALFTLVLLAAFTLVMTPAGPAGAASGVTWTTFDVELELLPSGSYLVTETQEIRFSGDGFSSGYATIPLDRLESISSPAITEIRNGDAVEYAFLDWANYNDDPETFSAQVNGTELEIAWGFPETRSASRTFVISYQVNGALRVYSDDTGNYEQIWWTAIDKQVTDVGAVESSTVTVTLPQAVDLATVKIGDNADEDPAQYSSDGRVFTWTRTNLEAGDDLEVRMEFPAIVGASPPAWQSEDDAVRLGEEKADDKQALINVAFLGIGLLSILLGLIGLLALWFGRGRDPQTGLVADFIPAPPDDLPPGAAGALIDEVAHERDVVATIVDLGRRGVIKIDESAAAGKTAWGGSDFTLTLLQSDPPVTAFERALLSSIFGGSLIANSTEQMSRARSRFSGSVASIKDAMYGELVTRGYFTSSPEETRDRWRTGGIVALIALVLILILGGSAIGDVSGYLFVPLVAAIVVALGVIALSKALPKKTLAGAEAAAKWEAFKRYLADIEKYDKLNESQTIFDKYLPYAVAFGLESSWVQKFAATGAQPPAWYGPVIIGNPGDWSRPNRNRRSGYGGGTWMTPSGGSSTSSQGGGGLNAPGFPDLQETSDRAGRGIQSTSNSFFDMLSSAAEAFSDFSSSSSSGNRRNWGGGGGGYRGGGGGRRSSGGGGRRSGSSGGGRRGFR